MLTIPLLPDLRAKVVAGLQEGRCDSCMLHLHSGVRLVNTTAMALDVGMQTPMGLVMGPQVGAQRAGMCDASICPVGDKLMCRE